MYKGENCWSTRYTKEEHNKVREGFKRHIHQYLADNNIDNDFNKNIMAIAFNTSPRLQFRLLLVAISSTTTIVLNTS